MQLHANLWSEPGLAAALRNVMLCVLFCAGLCIVSTRVHLCSYGPAWFGAASLQQHCFATLCQHLKSPRGNSTNVHLLLPLTGIFKYVINSEGLVTDIWFQRQPFKDEIARKVSLWAPLQHCCALPWRPCGAEPTCSHQCFPCSKQPNC